MHTSIHKKIQQTLFMHFIVQLEHMCNRIVNNSFQNANIFLALSALYNFSFSSILSFLIAITQFLFCKTFWHIAFTQNIKFRRIITICIQDIKHWEIINKFRRNKLTKESLLVLPAPSIEPWCILWPYT